MVKSIILLDLGRVAFLGAGQKWYGVVLETSVENGVVSRQCSITRASPLETGHIKHTGRKQA
ncbi:MAG: hypothetical protein QW506_02990 [Thermoproteota archaeon]